MKETTYTVTALGRTFEFTHSDSVLPFLTLAGRLSMGWIFIWSGFDKLITDFSSEGFLVNASGGPLKDIFIDMGTNQVITDHRRHVRVSTQHARLLLRRLLARVRVQHRIRPARRVTARNQVGEVIVCDVCQLFPVGLDGPSDCRLGSLALKIDRHPLALSAS